MSVGVFIMMFMYGGWLVWVASGFTVLYVLLRLSTYRYYRQASEEQLVKSAKASSHFMETLYSIATLKSLVGGNAFAVLVKFKYRYGKR